MMDNYEAVKCLVAMAKAQQDYLTTAGFPLDEYDSQAIVTVELMLNAVEEEKENEA